MPNNLTSKGQFVEIDFTAKVKQTGEVFDTTLKDVAKKANLQEERVKSFIICIGEGMVLQGFDTALESKEVGKEYTIDLPAKQAFGERNSSMVKIIPLKLFQSKGIMPYPGLTLNMDGLIARISAVSGGRVITDFNNPLAGKDIIYTFKVKRVVGEDRERLVCLVEVYFRGESEKAIKNIEGKKAKIKLSNNVPPKALEAFTQKVKELTGLEVSIESK